MRWYNDLYKLDSIISQEKRSTVVSIRNINNSIIKTGILDKYLRGSKLIKNCKTYNDLLYLEYIIGNEIIKDYNNFLIRAPLAKVIIDKDYDNITGKVYLSVYDPNNNNYVVINNDTIYSNGGILSVDIEKYKKDTLDVIGSYFYYKPEYGNYISMEFSL